MYDFGLTDEQFWELTKAEFQALSKRHREQVKHDDYRFGIIASNIANAHFKPPDGEKQWSPAYYFPMLKDKIRTGATRMTPTAMKRLLQLFYPPKTQG